MFDKKSSERLNDFVQKILQYRVTIAGTENKIEQLNSDMDKEQEGSPEYNMIGEQAQAAEEYVAQEQEELENTQKELEDFLATVPKAKYDRIQLDDNIRNYLEITGVPLGEIEVEGALSKGGLSRWEKNMMTSELPLSFVLTAAEKFKVTLPELLYGDPTQKSEDDDFIIQFMENLLQLTRKNKISWEEVEPEDRRAGKRSGIDSNSPRLYRDAEGVFYKPGFGYEGPFQADKHSYSAKLPESDDVVFLYSIDYTEGPSRSGMELYINVNGEGEQPVYSTYAANGVINYMIEGLYNMARQSSKEVSLGEGARNSMAKLAKYAETIQNVSEK